MEAIRRPRPLGDTPYVLMAAEITLERLSNPGFRTCSNHLNICRLRSPTLSAQKRIRVEISNNVRHGTNLLKFTQPCKAFVHCDKCFVFVFSWWSSGEHDETGSGPAPAAYVKGEWPSGPSHHVDVSANQRLKFLVIFLSFP